MNMLKKAFNAVKQKSVALSAGATTLVLVGSNAMAQTAPTVDYSKLTSAVDFTEITTVLLGVAALIIGFILVRNNIGVIRQFLSRKP